MNHRVLELLKAPKNIQSEDLDLLKEEINSFPYVQNIRALYLYGVNLYDKENYQKVLSTTAAYTTDKKILYQLINGKIQQKPKPEIVREKRLPAENPLKVLYQSKASAFPLKREGNPIVEVQQEILENPQFEENLDTKKDEFGVHPAPQQEIKHVFVDGERNRILFEGEENFLDDDNAGKIDLESTLESGSIVMQKVEKREEPEPVKEEIQQEDTVSEISDSEAVEEIEEFTPETVIEEEKINSELEKEEILDESQLSFHEIEPFASEIEPEEIKDTEIAVNKSENINTVEETAEFTPEKIIDEDKISSEKEEKTINDTSELSFHGMESFLPGVKIQANNSDEILTETSQSTIRRHEDEMRRLIEEVEKKMKEKAASSEIKKEEEPENTSHDISFAETQSFDVKPTEYASEQVQNEVVESPKENISEAIAKEATEVRSAWKPMSFDSHLPDSLINKPVEIPQQKIETEAPKDDPIQQEETKNGEPKKQEENLKEIEKAPENVTEGSAKDAQSTDEVSNVDEKSQEKEDVPVMNVSFFGSDISKWQVGESKKEEEKVEVKEEIQEGKVSAQKSTQNLMDSNVQGFINTWQSWLKIDRKEEETVKVVELKKKVIETFIETNPRISQLKEESSFVVKEKNDDISHLMTETLANLYFEQKLYTKAIKAFEILIKKTPEKKEYFEGRIQEIKDFRSKG